MGFFGFREVGECLLGARNVGAGFVAVVEVGEQLIIFLLCELIVLVIVAARAADSQSEPDGTQGLLAIHHRSDAPLLLVSTTLGVG